MDFADYRIIDIQQKVTDTYMIHIRPVIPAPVFDFAPGQFCQIKNPSYANPNEAHSFSIASSPLTKDYLEFCMKVYGPWTRALANIAVGSTVHVAGPFGRFVWDAAVTNAVFLAGGVGIVPFLSMLRFLKDAPKKPHITVIYGSRTDDTIVYQQEVDSLVTGTNSNVVHVLSHQDPKSSWSGYQGFVTKELLEKEVDFAANPTFFICGPPVFVDLMRKLLASLSIPDKRVRFELFSRPVVAQSK